MKGKALRKHSLQEKTAASVLLKLFMSGINDATPLTKKPVCLAGLTLIQDLVHSVALSN